MSPHDRHIARGWEASAQRDHDDNHRESLAALDRVDMAALCTAEELRAIDDELAAMRAEREGRAGK